MASWHEDSAARRALLASARPRRSLPVLSPAHSAPPLEASARPRDCQTVPRYAVWELTLACDLSCRHCGSRAGHARPDELDTAECLDLVDQLAALGVQEVSLIGGEAYLRGDWCRIIEQIARRGMTPLLTTGGRGLTAARARAAARAGLRSASVSLDGMAAVHDRLRGVPGAFAAARRALDHLRAAGVHVSVNTQLNRLSLADLPAVLETAIAHGAHAWQVQLTVAMGRAADEPELIFQPHELLELFPLLGTLAQRCAAAGVVLWPGNNVGYFGPHESTLRGTTALGHTGSCSAGCATLGIESDGTIKGCPSLATENWASGTVRAHRLVDIWQRAGRLRANRDGGQEALWGFCRTCYYAAACRGGCTWTAEALLGRPGNNPMCHHRALEHARLGKRERLVPVAPAPNRPFDQGRFALVVEDIA
jgi:radical SAM protein with 4Fe4S-binding SPASM domain